MGGRDEELVAGKSGDVHAFRRLGNEVAVSSREKAILSPVDKLIGHLCKLTRVSETV